ncbi:DUF2065 domain-containing protein [uncultured Mailhella sp.]|uniref:DUF2065 domain-containing protein n=1 Tax=uncultured Mailhella sp. TaxID=1981031 RepID=UPI0025E1F93E|nr:DUF2065 domain-containing protein [uncultured Mailhella sp.]
MNFNFSLFLAALGLACVLEALPWLISPRKTREMLLELLSLPDEALRRGGILLMILGVAVCAAGRFLRGD